MAQIGQQPKKQQKVQLYFRKWKRAGIFLGIGFAYYFLTQVTSFRIPCLFREVTTFACPGCGITHFFLRLMQLDISGAIQENVAVAALLLIWFPLLAIRTIWHPHWLRKNGTFEKILAFICIGLLLLFGIVRNLPGMAFLLPSEMRKCCILEEVHCFFA